MKEKIKRFLKDNSFLPLTKWGNFEVIHKGVPQKNQGKKDDLNSIKSHISGENGLYIYEKNKKIIYVGKGKPLFNRIKSHYLLAHQKLSGDTKDNLWHKFWYSKRNLGRLKIYWKEQKEERIREIIEKMLHYTLNPTFDSFKEKHEHQIQKNS